MMITTATRSLLALLVCAVMAVGLSGPATATPAPITLGEATTVNLPQPDSVATYTFTTSDDTGQVTVKVTDVTVPYGVVVSVTGPGGASTSGTASPPYLEVPVRAAGTWQVTVQAVKLYSSHIPGTGTAQLLVDLTHNISGAVTVGTPFTQTFPVAGQNAGLTFTGEAGQRIGFAVSAATVQGTYAWYGIDASLVGPPGSTPIPLSPSINGPTWRETGPLETSGTWTLRLDPFVNATGSITAALSVLKEVAGGNLTSGTAKTVPFTTPGNTQRLTFQGVAGRRPTLEITSRALAYGPPSDGTDPVRLYAEIYRPDGSFYSDLNPDADWSEGGALDVSGTWTLVLDPVADATGSLRLTLRQVNDTSSTLPLNRTGTLSSTVKGRNINLTFTGVIGKHLRLSVTRQVWTSAIGGGGAGSGSVYLRYLRPDGSEAGSGWLYLPGSDIPAVSEGPTMDVAGTWTVQVDPIDDTVGAITGKATLVGL